MFYLPAQLKEFFQQNQAPRGRGEEVNLPFKESRETL